MKTVKLFLFFILFLLSFSIVFATSSWTTWGNYGFSSGEFGDRVLFGSNILNGTVNARANVTDALTITYPPLIQDMNLDGANEIWIISGSTILLLDDAGEQIGSLSTGATLGRPIIANYQNDFDEEFMLCVDNDLNIYEFSSNVITLTKQWSDGCLNKNIVQTGAFDIGQTFDGTQANEFMFAGQSDDKLNISSIDYNTGVKTSFLTFANLTDTTGNRVCSEDNFFNSIIIADIDRDNEIEAIVLTEYEGALGREMKVVSVSLFDKGLDFESGVHTVGGSPFSIEECTMAYGQIGGRTSGFEIFTQSITGAGFFKLNIIDSSGNVVFNDDFATEDKSFWAIADVDFDGNNEACYSNNTAFKCLDNFYVPFMNISKSTDEDSDFIAIGEYNQVLDFQEFMTQSGIYSHDGSTASKIFDVGETTEESMIYPVSLLQTATINKDIVYFDKTKYSLFFTGGIPAVCGNGVCESGENDLVCFQDCGTTSEQEIVRITALEICPDQNFQWKNGTRVRVTAKVETTDGSQVQARLKIYSGSPNEEDSGFVPAQPSGNNFIFETFANFTGFGTLNIIGKSALSETFQDNFQTQFIVDTSEGVVFGSGCFSFEEPLPITTISSGAVDSPCDSDDQCDSGLCENNFCALKTGNVECSSGSQCISGQCINSKCTKPSYWDSVEASKTQQFGDDKNTNNFIALFFMILIPAGMIWLGRSGLAVLSATGTFLVLSFFFAIVGWLSPFILLAIILLIIIIMVFAFIVKGSSS